MVMKTEDDDLPETEPEDGGSSETETTISKNFDAGMVGFVKKMNDQISTGKTEDSDEQGRFARALQERKDWETQLTKIAERIEQLTGKKPKIGKRDDKRNGQYSVTFDLKVGGLGFFGNPPLGFYLTLKAGPHKESSSNEKSSSDYYKFILETRYVDVASLTRGYDFFEPGTTIERPPEATPDDVVIAVRRTIPHLKDDKMVTAEFTKKEWIDDLINVVFGNLYGVNAFQRHAKEIIKADNAAAPATEPCVAPATGKADNAAAPPASEMTGEEPCVAPATEGDDNIPSTTEEEEYTPYTIGCECT